MRNIVILSGLKRSEVEKSGRLHEKVAIITGGAGVIGTASCRVFAREGASIAIVDLADTGADLARAICADGGRAIFVKTDVTSETALARMVAEVIGAFGRIDVLFNNAGGSVAEDTDVTRTSAETFEKVIAYNLLSVHLCCRLVIPEMMKTSGGSIINAASVIASRGMPGGSAYAAAKGGVMSLTRQIAATHAASKIRCNTIMPGAVSSARIQSLLETSPIKEQLRANVARQMLGMVEPEQVAEAALFLASDESRFTTGQNIAVDGGFLNL
ncbi:SDR family NAD(P)-dependent oxidoreductase [Sphingomonadaceae bacterium G21617-S1]|nr:SDR family NAD(P)-dependent oxidoreductase [Sphingomonadaceae bacterium G21617-S1]